MAENNEIIESGKGELLNIFTEEEDKKGTDLLAMSDYFEVFIGKIETEMGTDTAWEVFHNIEGFIGEIAAAIKGGFDISKMGMLVADYSHFSQDIIDGLKEGIYHVGQSREVAGNLRPAILDENEHLVKFFTLKKAVNPASVLSDISTLSFSVSDSGDCSRKARRTRRSTPAFWQDGSEWSPAYQSCPGLPPHPPCGSNTLGTAPASIVC